jgi:hypothetical protein
MGLSYNNIHACYIGCVMFKGELNTTTTCPKSKMSWFVERSNQVLRKVFCHFSLIPRLKQMYKCSSLVELMTWHNANKSNDGLICFMCDSKFWKHIDSSWPNFAIDLYNIRLGLTLDQVNSYADHSTWPILFLIYNLPP